MHEHDSKDRIPATSHDEALRLAVVEAISRSEPIRAAALDSIGVTASHGTVVLTGHVPTAAHQYVAGHLASSVHGVEKVDNRLEIDEEVEGRIAVALSEAEATKQLRISVHVSEGAAVLFGAVEDDATASLVLSVAKQAAGTLEVRNSLRIVPPGSHALLLWQNSLEGRQMVQREVPVPAPDGADEAPAAEVTSTVSPVGEPA